MIQINDQGNAADRAWFTFFHEVAHILNGDQDFLDLEEPGGELGSDDLPEAELRANAFARDILIPHSAWQGFTKNLKYDRRGPGWVARARDFAEHHGVHASIVVGRMLKEGVVGGPRAWQTYNRLKQSFKLG